MSWRDYHKIADSEIERVKHKLLRLPNSDREAIETEYWHAKARLMGTELAGEQWDERATALRCDHDRADSAVGRAAWKMAQTEPTTAAGASALLSYIATDKGTGLFELGETDWHETAFRTVAAALAKITRPPDAAALLAAVRAEKARRQAARECRKVA